MSERPGEAAVTGSPQDPFTASGASTPEPVTSGESTPEPVTSGASTPEPVTSGASTPEPVTVVVTRRVKRGSEAAYERWLAGLLREAGALPGYLGAQVIRPASAAATGPHEYTSVFRFATVEHLRAFEDSELRRRALREVAPHVEADAVWKKLTGLELWFTPPAGTVMPQPSRWRMALVMIVVVYGLVLSIGKLVALALGTAPMPVRLLVTITIEVMLMTYVLMPRITRYLARWIYP